jgi:hypothetical protein
MDRKAMNVSSAWCRWTLVVLVFGALRAGAQVPVSRAHPEMEKFAKLIGSWKLVATTEPTAVAPKGGVDKGTMTVRKVFDGQAVEVRMKAQGSHGPYEGFALMWWDRQSNQFRELWCENLAGCRLVESIRVDFKTWTVKYNGEFEGKSFRQTVEGSFSEDFNSIHEVFMQSLDGGPEVKGMTIDYKRVSK